MKKKEIKNMFKDMSIYNQTTYRREYIEQYGFIIPSDEFINECIELMKGHKILSVMSGCGYLESLLHEKGIDITATDTHEWANGSMYSTWNCSYIKVQQKDALDAIETVPADMVIMSWPPYMDNIATAVAKMLHKKNIPLLYIGEEFGGCCADDSFFDYMDENADSDRSLEYNYTRFPFIYDNPIIYRWK